MSGEKNIDNRIKENDIMINKTSLQAIYMHCKFFEKDQSRKITIYKGLKREMEKHSYRADYKNTYIIYNDYDVIKIWGINPSNIKHMLNKEKISTYTIADGDSIKSIRNGHVVASYYYLSFYGILYRDLKEVLEEQYKRTKIDKLNGIKGKRITLDYFNSKVQQQLKKSNYSFMYHEVDVDLDRQMLKINEFYHRDLSLKEA